MKKITWKQKVGALALFLICGISPNDEIPKQSHLDGGYQIKAALQQQAVEHQEYIDRMIKTGRGNHAKR